MSNNQPIYIYIYIYIVDLFKEFDTLNVDIKLFNCNYVKINTHEYVSKLLQHVYHKVPFWNSVI